MLEEIIKNYLVSTAGVDPQKFEQTDLRVSELNLDSLGLIEMLFEVEDRYGFQIEQPMRFLNMTFTEMVAGIEAEVRQQNGGEIPALNATDPAA
jgi:acyl carrier protein